MFRLLPTSPNDGYTRSGVWQWGDKNTQRIQFKYRPALPERAYEYLAANKRTGAEKMLEVCSLVGEHVVSVSGIVDELDKPVTTLTQENVRRLPQPFLEKLIDCICGYSYEDLVEDLKN